MTVEVFEAIHRANVLMRRSRAYNPDLMEVALASWVADPDAVSEDRIILLASTLRDWGECMSNIAFAFMDAATACEAL